MCVRENIDPTKFPSLNLGRPSHRPTDRTNRPSRHQHHHHHTLRCDAVVVILVAVFVLFCFRWNVSWKKIEVIFHGFHPRPKEKVCLGFFFQMFLYFSLFSFLFRVSERFSAKYLLLFVFFFFFFTFRKDQKVQKKSQTTKKIKNK